MCLFLLEGSLQQVQDGLADFSLKIFTHEHIQQWVQAAVEKGQAGCYGDTDSEDVDQGFTRTDRCVINQVDYSHDVKRRRTQEESGDDGSDDLEGATRLAGQGAVPPETMDDDGIAGDDDGEGDDESQEEVGDGHGLMSKISQLFH